MAVEEVGVDGPSESSPMNKEELAAHLSAFPKNRLVEEVVSMWEELGELERELAMARQRARALDGELVNVRSKSGGRADLAELEERFRVAEARRHLAVRRGLRGPAVEGGWDGHHLADHP